LHDVAGFAGAAEYLEIEQNGVALLCGIGDEGQKRACLDRGGLAFFDGDAFKGAPRPFGFQRLPRVPNKSKNHAHPKPLALDTRAESVGSPTPDHYGERNHPSDGDEQQSFHRMSSPRA
jgi:hypothetical protein